MDQKMSKKLHMRESPFRRIKKLRAAFKEVVLQLGRDWLVWFCVRMNESMFILSNE